MVLCSQIVLNDNVYNNFRLEYFCLFIISTLFFIIVWSLI